jgi:hypothetical protein
MILLLLDIQKKVVNLIVHQGQDLQLEKIHLQLIKIVNHLKLLLVKQQQ